MAADDDDSVAVDSGGRGVANVARRVESIHGTSGIQGGGLSDIVGEGRRGFNQRGRRVNAKRTFFYQCRWENETPRLQVQARTC